MNIGVIGFGLRAEYVLLNFNQYEMGVNLTCVCDPQVEAAKERINRIGYNADEVRFYDDVDEMLTAENLDGIVVGTPCASHTDIAIQVMKYNIPMFLEKPVAISLDQIQRLQEASTTYTAEAVVSFPLRVTPICKKVKEIIDSGKLGRIEHVEAVNNVNYGRVYYHNWYRDDSLTGGLFLQKSTHDLDYINYLLGIKPVAICAMESKQVFKGDKEPGVTCNTCDEYKTCPESPFKIRHDYQDATDGEGCAFAKDTGNHDSASILTRYETGMHTVYTQNFVVRKAAGKRGARLIGYKGTLEFDFNTAVIKVYSHVSGVVETYEMNTQGLNHFGGDRALCENFVEVMKGTGKSEAPLSAGITSALMCLYARESATTDKFYKIEC
ncbi:MAG: Gfo/Idh/MocA family protein [Cellulosilyticaceae bacterium]